MQYNKIAIVMDQLNLFEIPKIRRKKKTPYTLYVEKTRPLSDESFTGYIGIPIWITILTKL